MTKVFPAIDLRDGGVVRLFQGDYAQTTRFACDPVETARGFQAAGARFLHVVDLDGALNGSTANFDVVAAIARATDLFVEVGGGVRSIERVQRYLDAGVARVILGTAAVKDPAFLAQALARFGAARIVVGVDLREGQVAVQGWTEGTGLYGLDFCRQLRASGVETVIATDIACDGAMAGTNRALYRQLLGIDGLKVVASGGISSSDDVSAVCALGVDGLIVGRALYVGALNLAEVLAVAGSQDEGAA